MLFRFSNLNLRAITNFVAGKMLQQSKSPTPNGLALEELEARIMLASVVESGGEVTVRGYATDDLITLYGNGAETAFTVSINSDAALTQTFQNADISKVIVYAAAGNDQILNTLHVPTEIFGQNGDDSIWGGFADDRIYGGAGADTIRGRSGDDYISGNGGEDTLLGEDGDDTLYGGNDHDLIYGQNGVDYLNGQLGNDRLRGGEGHDVLLGKDGDDLIYGDSGNDNILGGNGDDDIRAGSGDDRLTGGAGADRLFGQAGADTARGGEGDDYVNGGDQEDFLYGDDGLDTIVGGSGNDVLYGGNDRDIIAGQDGDDNLRGQAGDDYLVGQDGRDTINAGFGNDTVSGGLGDDTIFGVDGTNSLSGDDGDDRIHGGNALDSIDGGGGDDFLAGNAGDDVLIGSLGSDTLFGGSGDDHLSGGDDGDYLYGQDGNDVLTGGQGDDLILGNDGDDSIHASFGDDLIKGNSGTDRIYYSSNETDFQVDLMGGDYQVTDLRIFDLPRAQTYGVDLLTDVEEIAFGEAPNQVISPIADTVSSPFGSSEVAAQLNEVLPDGWNSTVRIVGDDIWLRTVRPDGTAHLDFRLGSAGVIAEIRDVSSGDSLLAPSFQGEVTDRVVQWTIWEIGQTVRNDVPSLPDFEDRFNLTQAGTYNDVLNGTVDVDVDVEKGQVDVWAVVDNNWKAEQDPFMDGSITSLTRTTILEGGAILVSRVARIGEISLHGNPVTLDHPYFEAWTPLSDSAFNSLAVSIDASGTPDQWYADGSNIPAYPNTPVENTRGWAVSYNRFDIASDDNLAVVYGTDKGTVHHADGSVTTSHKYNLNSLDFSGGMAILPGIYPGSLSEGAIIEQHLILLPGEGINASTPIQLDALVDQLSPPRIYHAGAELGGELAAIANRLSTLTTEPRVATDNIGELL